MLRRSLEQTYYDIEKEIKMNKKSILILGASGSGKTFSLKRLINEHGDKVAYINLDGKDQLPFKGKPKIAKFITPKDPLELVPGARAIEEMAEIEYVIVDTMSHWLRVLEQKYVIESEDSRGAWGKTYQANIGELLHFTNNVSKKTWIFISHVMEGDVENFKTPIKAFVKGSTKSVGIESWFSTVIYTDITDDPDEPSGVKYRFLVQKTRETTRFSVKTPEDMFPEPYTENNDIMVVLDAIDNYNEE